MLSLHKLQNGTVTIVALVKLRFLMRWSTVTERSAFCGSHTPETSAHGTSSRSRPSPTIKGERDLPPKSPAAQDRCQEPPVHDTSPTRNPSLTSSSSTEANKQQVLKWSVGPMQRPSNPIRRLRTLQVVGPSKY